MDVDGSERNPELDSFETVMAAMEKELERLKAEPRTTASESSKTTNGHADAKGKGKAKVMPTPGSKLSTFKEVGDVEEGGGEDILDLQRSMDAELRSSLRHDMEVVSSDEDDGDSEEVPMDYNLIKNFLESFKSQQGLTGPVQGLAGRLQGSDWALPRDG